MITFIHPFIHNIRDNEGKSLAIIVGLNSCRFIDICVLLLPTTNERRILLREKQSVHISDLADMDITVATALVEALTATRSLLDRLGNGCSSLITTRDFFGSHGFLQGPIPRYDGMLYTCGNEGRCFPSEICYPENSSKTGLKCMECRFCQRFSKMCSYLSINSYGTKFSGTASSPKTGFCLWFPLLLDGNAFDRIDTSSTTFRAN
jgi:hypothetical protein